ncbi:MAG TPA: PAS domain-containing sensor histidine kinase, partial [Chitinophagaceae bacterium]|nr:PAS domain-containing sensor histidine kinase [Chitinophagaceae bacterium]
LTGKEGKIVLVNPAAERIFGYQSAELVSETIEVLIPEQFRHHHHELRKGFYETPSNRAMGHGRDLYGRKKDGTPIPLEVSLSHYKKDDQLFVIAFIVDITGRKEIEHSMLQQQKQLEKVSNEMRKLNAELELKVEERTLILKEALQRLEQSQMELSEALDKEKQLNEIKSRFVSMASHEFRTPLSTVLSSASLLEKYKMTEEQEKRSRHIDKIKKSVHHLNDILEDFLSLGKLDEDKVRTDIGDFDLQEFIREISDEMKGLLKKDQQLLHDFQGNATIRTDKKLLKNIIINLITNAIKFSKESSPIRIQTIVAHNRAVISVVDEGIGIAREDQDHLFSSFFRGANAANIAGTGLGLHIVKRYTNLLKGTVDLHSELNKGTTVTINIPVNADEQQDEQ